VVLGMMFSVAFGVAVSLVFGVVVGVAFGVVVGVAEGVVGGMAVGLFFIIGYLRLPLYLLELPWAWWVSRSVQASPTQAELLWRYHPLQWDELIWFPLWGVDQHLVSLVQQNQAQGLQAVQQVAGRFRQAGAAQQALITLTTHQIEQAQSLQDMAQLNEQLAWLPLELPPTLENLLPRLSQIAERITAVLASETATHQLEQLQKAKAEINDLRTGQAFATPQQQPLTQALQQWLGLLKQYENRLIVELEATFIPNVYVAGSPLSEKSRIFKGRQPLFRQLEQQLTSAAEQHPTLLLYGPRRSGKTSALKQLPQALGPDYIPIEIDLQSAQVTKNIQTMLRYIATQIRDKSLIYRRLKLPAIPSTSLADDPYRTFLDWLTLVEQQIKPRFLLLNLDEYERLTELFTEKQVDRQLFNWLRSMIQHHPHIVILLSGSHRPQELPQATLWHDALINTTLLRVRPLLVQEARELITQPVPGFRLQYEAPAVALILALSGLQPYLIQAICRVLVTYLNEEERLQATSADVELVVPTCLDNIASFLYNLWQDNLSDLARQILQHLAHDAPLTELSQQPGYRAAVRLLQWRDLIHETTTESGPGYQFQASLVKRWVRDYVD